MKSFLSHNWYKLMIASSSLIFSIGFLLYAISPSYANTNEEKVNTPSRNYVNVPVNADGSVNIRLSEEQLKKIMPNAVQDVTIAKIYTYTSGAKAMANYYVKKNM